MLLGVVMGLSALAMIAASCATCACHSYQVGAWLRKIAKRFGLQAFAKFLKKRGYDRLAGVVTLQLSDLLMLWNPEKGAARSPARAPAPTAESERNGATPRRAGPYSREQAAQAA